MCELLGLLRKPWTPQPGFTKATRERLAGILKRSPPGFVPHHH